MPRMRGEGEGSPRKEGREGGNGRGAVAYLPEAQEGELVLFQRERKKGRVRDRRYSPSVALGKRRGRGKEESATAFFMARRKKKDAKGEKGKGNTCPLRLLIIFRIRREEGKKEERPKKGKKRKGGEHPTP